MLGIPPTLLPIPSALLCAYIHQKAIMVNRLEVIKKIVKYHDIGASRLYD